MAQLDMPANVYNWLVHFFSGHTPCTVYRGQVSMMKFITASIIQGTGVGPASYVINAGDLEARTVGNKLCKFADVTYLIIPAINADSRSAELDNIETWARTNNLTLNRMKSKEIVFVDTKRKRQDAATTTWNSPSHVSEGCRRHRCKLSVRNRPYSWRHHQLRANSLCVSCAPTVCVIRRCKSSSGRS